MLNSQDIVQDGTKLYNKLGKKYQSNEELLLVLEIARIQAIRSSSIRDIEQGRHLANNEIEDE